MIRIFLSATLCVAASCAWAQPKSVSLSDCVTQAIEANYGVKIARSREAIAANNIVLTPFLPTVGANARQNYESLGSRETYRSQDDVKRDYSTNTYSVDAGLAWRLFDGMAMFADYDTRRELLREGELNLRNNMENLIADVAQQYCYIVTQQNRLKASRLYLEISMMRYNQAKEKYGIGTISGLEMKQAKIDLNADSSNLVLQQQVIENGYIQLYEMMNVDLRSKMELCDTIAPNESLMLDRLIVSAMEQNTSILMARSGMRLSDLDLRIARSARYPTLDFDAGYRFNHNRNGSAATRFSELHGPSFGFTISAKLFNGLETSRKIRNAKIETQISELTYRQTELGVESSISQLYNIYRKNIAMIGFEAESAEAALLNLQAAMEMYRLGTMSGVEFREIQRSYLQAVDRKLDAIYQAKVSEISLMHLVGQIM